MSRQLIAHEVSAYPARSHRHSWYSILAGACAVLLMHGCTDTGVADMSTVIAARNAVQIGYEEGDRIDRVTQNLTLPTVGANGVTIKWQSNATHYVTDSGEVFPPVFPAENVETILIATLTKNSASVTGTFPITLIALPDQSPPRIVLESDTVITFSFGDTFADPGATVTDNDPAYNGMVTSIITDDSDNDNTPPTIDTAIVGTYTITYTAPMDLAGNSPLSVTRTVIVNPDTDAPVIRLLGGDSVVAIGGRFTDRGATVTDNDPAYNGMVTSIITDDSDNTPPTIDTAIVGTYTITYDAPMDVAGHSPLSVTRTVQITQGINADNDMLIDISSLEQLDAIRFNLEGTSYKISMDGDGVQCGTAFDIDCRGYELTRDLDFADADSYDARAINPEWRPQDSDDTLVALEMADSAVNAGWIPIGSCHTDNNRSGDVCRDSDDTPFATLFAGNGYAIHNLYARSINTTTGAAMGLFGLTNANADIRAVGVMRHRIYGNRFFDHIGGLVGRNLGAITASYAIGFAFGEEGGDNIGGLIGTNLGAITASYATGTVDSGSDGLYGGGLIGNHRIGTITASYATGKVIGRDLVAIGGLIGVITSSFRTTVITASYASSTIVRGNNENSLAGGLIAAATGTHRSFESYHFSTLMNPGQLNSLGVHPDNLPSANALTASNVGESWNDAARNTMGAWDFGTTSQAPALRYADYDGNGNLFACDSDTTPPGGAIIIPNCGTLISGQR